MVLRQLILTLLLFHGITALNDAYRKFPDGFRFGAATASYQIEGAWNESDKGENIWDHVSHQTKLVLNGDTGDVACDSYHQYERDIEMLKVLGVDFYRFSISWSRILPTGFDNKRSQDGIAYYNNLINGLIANGITPVVTLYHWDLPQPLQDIGGWTNPLLEKYFVDYARICFDTFGYRVKEWITFNEPYEVCQAGYGGDDNAPALKFDGTANYLCTHTLLKAHARVYHLYDEVYRPAQKGRIGLTLSGRWYEPEDTHNIDDVRASETALQFVFGWYAHPIFSDQGDYPEVMKLNIAIKSAEQGFSSSRLPQFTPEEVEYIKGTSDYFGVNHYTSSMVRAPKPTDVIENLSFWEDTGVIAYQPDDWPSSPASSWIKIAPWGFYKLLKWFSKTYNDPEIVILENGYSTLGGIEDEDRISYYHLYLNAMMDAIDDGCNITAYTVWSLMDNFEWMVGYRDRFGLYEVDFNDPKRKRTARGSAKYYANIIDTKMLERSIESFGEK